MADEPITNIELDVEGYEVVTSAIIDLINDYPGLDNNDKFAFGKMPESGGKAVYPVSGSVIESTRRDILGSVEQTCVYPIYAYYRAGSLSESRKQAVKEWLDNLGRWLEKQPVTIAGTEYKLDEYPELTGNRRFLTIQRTSPAALIDVNSNNTEDWAISLNVRYKNSF